MGKYLIGGAVIIVIALVIFGSRKPSSPALTSSPTSNTVTPTATPLPSALKTPGKTYTPTPKATASVTPKATTTPSLTPTPTPAPSATPTPIPSATATPSATPTPTATPKPEPTITSVYPQYPQTIKYLGQLRISGSNFTTTINNNKIPQVYSIKVGPTSWLATTATDFQEDGLIKTTLQTNTTGIFDVTITSNDGTTSTLPGAVYIIP